MSTQVDNGYMGQILKVDLSERTATSLPLPETIRDMFLGGRAMATAMLFEILGQQSDGSSDPIETTDPLSPQSPLVFCASPVTGTNVPTSSRFHVAFKSPLTGGIGSSNSGGKWGVFFKKAGFDALIVTGRATSAVILFIDEDGVRFESAHGLPTDDVEQITDAIHEMSSSKYKVMTVGSAGRNLSPISCIINDRGRALGRGGSGAVFGAKNLYAIAVNGKKKVPTFNPTGLESKNTAGSVYKANAKLRLGKITKPKDQYGILSSMGTNGLMGMLAQYDELLHRNFLDNQHDEADLAKIQGEAFLSHDRVKVKRGACRKCPIGCTRVTKIEDSEGNVISKGEGPEFETVAMFGANLHVYDLEAITEVNYRCNRFGFDTISMGGTIAALMELYETAEATPQSERSEGQQKLIEDSQDLVARVGPIRFGNSDCLVPLVEAAASGTGIGRVVALGAKRLAETYGSVEAAMTVKGMELPAYDPRATWTQALSYIVSPRGGCHLQGGYSAPLAFCAGYGEFPGNKAEGAAIVARNVCYQNYIYDMLGVCAFAGFSVTLDELAKMVNDVVGSEHKGSDLEQIARKGLTLERLFNQRCGLTMDDDWLPKRFFENPIRVDGAPTVLDPQKFANMRREFYESVGWDERGIPSDEILDKMGLSPFLVNTETPPQPGKDS